MYVKIKSTATNVENIISLVKHKDQTKLLIYICLLPSGHSWSLSVKIKDYCINNDYRD